MRSTAPSVRRQNYYARMRQRHERKLLAGRQIGNVNGDTSDDDSGFDSITDDAFDSLTDNTDNITSADEGTRRLSQKRRKIQKRQIGGDVNTSDDNSVTDNLTDNDNTDGLTDNNTSADENARSSRGRQQTRKAQRRQLGGGSNTSDDNSLTDNNSLDGLTDNDSLDSLTGNDTDNSANADNDNTDGLTDGNTSADEIRRLPQKRRASKKIKARQVGGGNITTDNETGNDTDNSLASNTDNSVASNTDGDDSDNGRAQRVGRRGGGSVGSIHRRRLSASKIKSRQLPAPAPAPAPAEEVDEESGSDVSDGISSASDGLDSDSDEESVEEEEEGEEAPPAAPVPVQPPAQTTAPVIEAPPADPPVDSPAVPTTTTRAVPNPFPVLAPGVPGSSPTTSSTSSTTSSSSPTRTSSSTSTSSAISTNTDQQGALPVFTGSPLPELESTLVIHTSHRPTGTVAPSPSAEAGVVNSPAEAGESQAPQLSVDQNGPNTGEAVGIVFGTLALIALLVLAAFMFMRMRKRRGHDEKLRPFKLPFSMPGRPSNGGGGKWFNLGGGNDNTEDPYQYRINDPSINRQSQVVPVVLAAPRPAFNEKGREPKTNSEMMNGLMRAAYRAEDGGRLTMSSAALQSERNSSVFFAKPVPIGNAPAAPQMDEKAYTMLQGAPPSPFVTAAGPVSKWLNGVAPGLGKTQHSQSPSRGQSDLPPLPPLTPGGARRVSAGPSQPPPLPPPEPAFYGNTNRYTATTNITDTTTTTTAKWYG